MADERWETEMFCGRGIGKGKMEVSPGEWQKFCSQRVTRDFKGFTVYDANGFYRGKPEQSWVLKILHDGSVKSRRKLRGICVAYRRRFGQQSVWMAHTIIDLDKSERLHLLVSRANGHARRGPLPDETFLTRYPDSLATRKTERS